MNDIRLVLADVDGTLVTHDKILTPRALEAVKRLRAAGIEFAITSGRPPRGTQMLIDPLELSTPIAAFNGGMFVDENLTVIEQSVLERKVVERVIQIVHSHGLDVWIYRGNEWYVPNRHGPHVEREQWTVKFPPMVVGDFTPILDGVAKIVGVSDDLDAVCRCEKAVQAAFATEVCCQQTTPLRTPHPAVSSARSQPYYLDTTHAAANKGEVAKWLARRFKIPASSILTLGDMPNDIAMFKQSGQSVAMGQASDEVKRAATFVTTSSEEEGFATAIERYALAGALLC